MQACRFVFQPVGLSVVDCSTPVRTRQVGCVRGSLRGFEDFVHVPRQELGVWSVVLVSWQ